MFNIWYSLHMIISIIGIPASGKSSLLKSIMKSLGEPERINFGQDFKCTKFNDILVLGQYGERTFSGTDSWKYSSIATGVFENFLNFKVKDYRHIIFEGDRLTSKVKFCAKNFDTKVYLLNINEDEENERQASRGNKQTSKWLKSRHSQMRNLQNEPCIQECLVCKDNNTLADANSIKDEILKLLL